MNTKTTNTRLRTKFAPEIRFEVTPEAAAPARGDLENALEQFKARLLRDTLRETPYPEFDPLLRRAANEAAALAWLTPFPLLLLPGLIDEKARQAVELGLRQERVRTRSRKLFRMAEAV